MTSPYTLRATPQSVDVPVTPPETPPVTPPVLSGDVEPNSSLQAAGSAGVLTSGVANVVYGSVAGSDQEDWYRVTLSSGGSLRVDLSGLSTDLDLQVRDRNGLILGGSYRFSSADDGVVLNGLSAGDYYVRVYGFGSSSSSYRLSTLFTASGPVAPPVIVGSDSEPNDSRWSASAFGTMRTGAATSVTGSLSSSESDDWFVLNLSDSSSLSVELTMSNWRNGRGVLNRCDIVTHVQLCDAWGNVLQDSTPAFGTTNRSGVRRLSLTSLSAGTYYLRVFRTSSGLASPYTLSATPAAV